MTAERTHLSIGEVLSLLQPEFPDITISKIRFLESQGLLDPERTPSGYRKFHDDDIERLRWILTQQRDHFLPLKVIKDRLASGDLGNGAAEGVLPLAAESRGKGDVVPAWAPTGADPADSAPDAAVDVAEAAALAADDAPDVPDPAGNGQEAAASASDPEPETETEEPAAGHDGEDGDGGETPEAAADASRDAVPAAAADHDRAEAVGRIVEAPEEPEPEPAPEAEAAPEIPAPKGRRRHPTGHQPGEPTPAIAGGPGADTDTDTPVAALTLDDLVERSGLSARDIDELERYGLIAGYTDGPDTTYDEEALVVARLAVGFSRYGIEPRHLRMYKVAAEREAGLFEQLISPLLKQRRPSARQQAVEMLEDLAELADDLRAAMVRTALREYLGGS